VDEAVARMQTYEGGRCAGERVADVAGAGAGLVSAVKAEMVEQSERFRDSQEAFREQIAQLERRLRKVLFPRPAHAPRLTGSSGAVPVPCGQHTCPGRRRYRYCVSLEIGHHHRPIAVRECGSECRGGD
jgi:hypothetical protein